MATTKTAIFLADDEHAFRESVQDALEDAGYFVLSARDGVEALARMRGYTGRALAIVDLNMPEMGGMQLIDAMRRDPQLSRIPILVVSSEDRRTVAGADRLLRKPVQLEKLMSAVHELLA